jgi:hypothetical protein
MLPLTDLQRALLTCLLRTPFLRVQDLARELATGRNKVYQCLNDLLAQGLLEQFARPTSASAHGPCWLYTVSPAGQSLVRETLTEADLPSGRWEISERFLRALLPRLDRLVCGQTMVHRLLVQAPRAFARQGKPAVVRWSWTRDYEHIVPSRRTPGCPSGIRVFADWLLVLRVRQDGEQQELWYPLFVFFDAACFSSQLIGQRLQALLHWRQALARRRILDCERFPPALILLPGWQRAWRWQQQAAELTRERIPPLRGGLTVWATASAQKMQLDPWQLPWRPLSPADPGALCNLLCPVPPQAMPARWLAAAHHQRRAGGVGAGSRASRRGASRTPDACSWSLGRRARRVDPTIISRKTLGLVGLSLQRAHYHLLELLQACPLASRENLMVFLAIKRASVQRLLTTVQAYGCLASEVLPGEQQPRYFLSGQGLRLLALRHHLLPGGMLFKEGSELAELAVLRQGVNALRSRSASASAVYAFFTRLIQQAACCPGHRLLWWELGDAALSLPTGSQRQPHAMGEYQAHGRQVRFWLDWQEVWSHEASVQQTLSGYAALLRALERHNEERPLLLAVCPDEARVRQVRHCAQQLVPFPWQLVFATTREQLLALGPLAPIWQVAGPVESAAGGNDDTRRCWYISGQARARAGHLEKEREL